MSKREMPRSHQSVLKITGGQIKGYHEFKIKGPEGTPVYVYPESGNEDPFALRCVFPGEADIPATLLDVKMVSTSTKKTYTLREVAGRQIGRVQYFLNREMKHLLDCGKIDRIKGMITGKPTTTKRTPVHQKWQKNVTQGGGVFIPCHWTIQCREDCIEEVERRIPLVISEMGEEGTHMTVEIVKTAAEASILSDLAASPSAKKAKKVDH